jgi:4-hydroxymandelate oxidase
MRERSRTRIVLKGIVTAEDAELALRHGVDGLIVSNHGGRQEESDRSTIESLPEVAAAVDGRLPILIDGGVRRGTDVFKALALGASAVSIGRPYCWGLAASGHEGVARALEILHGELERIMQFSGTTSVSEIGRGCVETRHGRE